MADVGKVPRLWSCRWPKETILAYLDQKQPHNFLGGLITHNKSKAYWDRRKRGKKGETLTVENVWDRPPVQTLILYFPCSFKKGGVASGMKHVETNTYNVKRLLHVKGKNNVVAGEVGQRHKGKEGKRVAAQQMGAWLLVTLCLAHELAAKLKPRRAESGQCLDVEVGNLCKASLGSIMGGSPDINGM